MFIVVVFITYNYKQNVNNNIIYTFISRLDKQMRRVVSCVILKKG